MISDKAIVRGKKGGIRIAIGIVLVTAAAVGIAYPIWWNNRSATGAANLLRKDLTKLQQTSKGAASTRTVGSTQSASQTCKADPGPGILSIPKLSLTAPVEQGLTDGVLNIAIGHDPSTSWPGPNSASLFAAHDVSFFSRLNQLSPGDIITYTVPCATYTFKVEGARITSPGSPISVPNEGALILDTCYPPNALWYTPDRYIVTASFASSGPQDPRVASSLSSQVAPPINYTVNVPPTIPPQELQLANNSQEMGQLSFTGSPSASFQQSNAPLQVEAAGLEGWFAILHAIESNQPTWWKAIVSNVAFPQGMAGGTLKSTSPLEITEDVTGSTPHSITLTGSINSTSIKVTGTFTGTQMSVSDVVFN